MATASPGRDPEVAPASSTAEGAGSAAPAPVDETIAPPHTDASHLANPRPKYPPESRRRREQGTVVLDVHILPDGSVAEVRLKHSSGHGLLDRAAADAVRLWRYVPAKRGDTPIAFWYEQPIVFALKR
jgi:periplasmic protein TonB